MNPLVHHRATTVELQGALPAAIIIGGPVPFDVRAAEHQITKPTRLECGLNGAGAGAEAGLKDGGNLHLRGIRRRQELIDALNRDLDRLFDHHVLACLHCCEGGFQVRPAGSRHADDVDVRTGQQFGDVGGGETHLVLFRQPLDGLRHDVGHANQPGTIEMGNGLGMKIGNYAATDDAKAEGFR